MGVEVGIVEVVVIGFLICVLIVLVWTITGVEREASLGGERSLLG